MVAKSLRGSVRSSKDSLTEFEGEVESVGVGQRRGSFFEGSAFCSDSRRGGRERETVASF